jgi:outer membrane receptor protein involved in Fe transport
MLANAGRMRSLVRPFLAVAALSAGAWAGDDEALRREVDAYLEEAPDDLLSIRARRFPDPWLLLASPKTKRVVDTTLPVTTVEAATLTERSLSETVPALNLVTKKDVIKHMPLGVAESLWWQPGIWTTQGASAFSGSPMIRGWQGNQVLLLLDGVRLTRDRTPTGPSSDWEILDPYMVDRIEVLRSPDSVLYGTGAIGGVTALYTAFPVDYPDSGKVYGGRTWVNLASGGFNYWRWRLEGYAATPEYRASLGGTLLRSNEIHTPDKQLSNTAIDTNEVDGHVEWKVNDANTLGFWIFAMRKSWDGDYLHPSRVMDNSYERQAAAVSWRNTNATSLWDDVQVQVGASRWKQVQTRYDNPDRRDDENWVPQATAYFHKQLGDRHLVTYGLSSWVNTTEHLRTRNGVALRGVPKGFTWDVGVFGQDEWQATERLRVVYGLRLDGVWAKTDPDAATTDPIIDPEDIRIDQTDFAWTGKAGVRYKATDRISLTGNFSRGYRFPSLTDLAGFVQAPDEIIVGDPTTSPEYSNTLEGGFHFTSPRVRGSIVGYVSWYEDAIIRTYGSFKGMTWIDRDGDGVQDNDEDIYLTTNAGTARFWGIEAAGVVDVTPQLSVFGNLTWWDGKIEPDPTEPIGIPFNGTIGVNYHPNDRVYFELASHMVAKFDMIPQAFYDAEAFFFKNPQDESEGPLRNDHAVPGYTLFDFRMGVKVTDKATVTLNVDNLLNKTYRRFGDRRDGHAFTVLCGFSLDF